MIGRASLSVSFAISLYGPTAVIAQDSEGCTLRKDTGRGPVPTTIYYRSPTGERRVPSDAIITAASTWNACQEKTPSLVYLPPSDSDPTGGEIWTIDQASFDDFKIPQDRRRRCAEVPYGTEKIVRIFSDRPADICGKNDEYLVTSLMHEMGHTLPIHDDRTKACRDARSIMSNAALNVKALQSIDCQAAQKLTGRISARTTRSTVIAPTTRKTAVETRYRRPHPQVHATSTRSRADAGVG